MNEQLTLKEQNDLFYEEAETAFRELFEAAKNKHELHFAMALMPEMRGARDPGWNTAYEAQLAFKEYLDVLDEIKSDRIRSRIALGFYCHLAEASGFYEVPKNMLRISEGEPHLLWPFLNLVQTHRKTGNKIAPNANKVLRDLAGHAKTLGFDKLSVVFRDAFNSDIRNGYSHADYVIWADGLRLPKRNGGYPLTIKWEDFSLIFDRGINFFNILQEIISEYTKSYDPPKIINASLQNEPKIDWTIYYDTKTGAFGITTGKYPKSEN